ncbi:nitrous oxide reductase accessory protein NosL [Arcobacter sp. LA11]|uniref:nitrous oxide reductase accessory protein NosL n=1 Tax=Arcobacter sp. LA11 TaxID=1898176 RepID=UPI000934D888|nr:nitrous oxide reductase accessory protein NosL [Arcobacter sp. LA11]
MRNLLFSALAILLLVSASSANEMAKKQKKMRYTAVPASQATLVQEGDSKAYCPVCGMTLPIFYKTNHAAKSADGMKQYCSIHCLVEDKIINKADLAELKVVNNSDLKFIKAKDAFYVVGSNKPATMAMVSKYGFAKKEDAQKFAKANGGEIKTFDDVFAMVSSELKKESAMIAKRQKKMQMMGEKVYNKMCKEVHVKFNSTAQAKTYISKNKLCGELKGKKLQAVGIYLSRR